MHPKGERTPQVNSDCGAVEKSLARHEHALRKKDLQRCCEGEKWVSQQPHSFYFFRSMKIILGVAYLSMSVASGQNHACADENSARSGSVVSPKLQKCISLCSDNRSEEHKIVQLEDDNGHAQGYKRVLVDDRFLISLSLDGAEVYSFSRLKYNPDGSEDRAELSEDNISWIDAFNLVVPILEICEKATDYREYYRTRTVKTGWSQGEDGIWEFMSKDFTQEGIPCRNSRFQATVGSRSRRILSWSYAPCPSPPKNTVSIAERESKIIVSGWLNSDGNGILSATQSEVICEDGLMIRKVIACPQESVGFGTSQESDCTALCWEVPIRFSMINYNSPFTLWAWVRVDTGEIFGGTLVPPVETMHEFVICAQ